MGFHIPLIIVLPASLALRVLDFNLLYLLGLLVAVGRVDLRALLLVEIGCINRRLTLIFYGNTILA